MRGQAEKQLKRYPDALSTFDELIKSQSLAFSDKARYERAMILVEQEEWLKAREAFATLSEDNPLYSSALRFSQGLERMDQIPQKSPAVAGTLAAILPGAGHLYTERPRMPSYHSCSTVRYMGCHRTFQKQQLCRRRHCHVL